MDYKNLRTVKQIVENAYPVITDGKMRHWIFHAETNGFAKVIVRVGGRIYIDRDAFNDWLNNQRDEPYSADDFKDIYDSE